MEWMKPELKTIAVNSGSVGPTTYHMYLLSQGFKRCVLCENILPLSNYYLNSKGRAVSADCKACRRVYEKDNYDRHLERQRRYRTGAPDGTYERLVSLYGAQCMICGATEPGRNDKVFCLDHDRDRKLVRGLLCHPCNSGIGLLNHDIELLQKAIDYLYTFEEREGLASE